MTALIPIPNMLLIGSAGRNSGKTVLACQIINGLKSNHHVTGLKVSTIHPNNGRCLRGGEGCGVCTSLDGDYCITKEINSTSGKDTARMLEAGAKDVYWLRARTEHLRSGIDEVLSMIPPDRPIVCESNSLRTVAVPAVFLMMKQRDSDECKSSAAAVMDDADKIIRFDGAQFDTDLSDITYKKGQFCMRHQASLILLAGGASSRMGQPKSLLPFQGMPLIQYIHKRLSPLFSETLVSANEELPVDMDQVTYVQDKIPGYGPIGGVVSTMGVMGYDKAFVSACDIPTIHIDLVMALLRASRNYDIVVPRNKEGYLEPLHAVYRLSILAQIEEMISSGEKRIRRVYEQVNTCYIDLLPSQRLENINTPAEYRQSAN